MRRQELKVKDIDLLEVYQKSKDAKVYAPWIKYAIPPLLITLVFGSVYGFISFQNYQLHNEMNETSVQLKKLQEEIATNPNVKIYEEILLKETSAKIYEKMYTKIASYPILQTGTFQAIEASAYSDIQISSLTYARESQEITLQIETPFANGTETFVRRLKDTEKFNEVTYSGYSQVKKSSTPTKNETKSMSGLSAEEILQYLNKNDTTQVDNTYTVYTATVQCSLK